MEDDISKFFSNNDDGLFKENLNIQKKLKKINENKIVENTEDNIEENKEENKFEDLERKERTLYVGNFPFIDKDSKVK
jgi:hypothetical protein